MEDALSPEQEKALRRFFAWRAKQLLALRTGIERLFHTSKVLKSEYMELFKDGLSEGEGVGLGIHFQQKMICETKSTRDGSRDPAFRIFQQKNTCDPKK